MKLEYINRAENNSRLILIYAGWSTGQEMYEDISMPGWDVALVSDYSDLNLDTHFLDEYYTIYLFAWSLGVFAAEHSLSTDRITAAIAINGTIQPVDDLRGIPTVIYEGTTAGLNERTLGKFRRRMMPDSESYNRFFGETHDNIESLRESLTLIEKEALGCAKSPHLPWIRAYIGNNDRIFPPENQKRSWGDVDDLQIIEQEAAHYIPVSSIVRSVIADTATVSKRFAKASISYDANAIAQQAAAVKLASKLRGYDIAKGCKTLEIGCGTGLLTREYAQILQPGEATFVDIAPTGPFGIAEKERYYTEDAELWMERNREKFDVILSSSAIQWFADIPRFIKLCKESLNPGGVLAISTFLPGNMRELDALRPSPIIYPTYKQLEEMMANNFSEWKIDSEEICVEFQSSREMMMHLKRTGVAGSSPTSGGKLKDIREVHKLTYTPVYMTGK
jgi:malonyl-ACP O-methyltransferase BioC